MTDDRWNENIIKPCKLKVTADPVIVIVMWSYVVNASKKILPWKIAAMQVFVEAKNKA